MVTEHWNLEDILWNNIVVKITPYFLWGKQTLNIWKQYPLISSNITATGASTNLCNFVVCVFYLLISLIRSLQTSEGQLVSPLEGALSRWVHLIWAIKVPPWRISVLEWEHFSFTRLRGVLFSQHHSLSLFGPRLAVLWMIRSIRGAEGKGRKHIMRRFPGNHNNCLWDVQWLAHSALIKPPSVWVGLNLPPNGAWNLWGDTNTCKCLLYIHCCYLFTSQKVRYALKSRGVAALAAFQRFLQFSGLIFPHSLSLFNCVVWVGSEFAEWLTIQGYIINANQAFRLNVISLLLM